MLKLIYYLIRFIFYFFALSGFAFAESTSNSACSRIPDALQAATQLYGLSKKQPISCRSLPAKEFKEAVIQMLSRQYPGNELMLEEKSYKMLGLIPEKYSYASCLLKTTAQNTSAFYDHAKSEIIVPDFEEVATSTLVHEIVHALQDQHFELKDYANLYYQSTDLALAAAALAEGEAARVEELFLASSHTKLDNVTNEIKVTTEEECHFPTQVEDLFTFGYQYGKKFIDFTLRTKGKDALENIWKNRAIYSSAQFLGYKKYPIEVFRQQAELTNNYRKAISQRHPFVVYNDALGQFGLITLFKHGTSHKIAVSTAVNLIGDFLFLENHNSNYKLYWYTLWPDQAAAEKFKLTFGEYFRTRENVTVSCNSLTLKDLTNVLFQCQVEIEDLG